MFLMVERWWLLAAGLLLLTLPLVRSAPVDDEENIDELLESAGPESLQPQERPVRQAEADKEPGDPNCDFGEGGRPTLCDYKNPNMSALTWMASTGASGNWLGGPPRDATDDQDGGYAFFETSTIPMESAGNTESAMLESPMMDSTGPSGRCLKFQYTMMGLSVHRLRVLLHPVSEEEKDGEMADHRDDIVIWSSPNADGMWHQANQLYTYGKEHTIVFEAIPMKGDERRYRGYVAVDSVDMGPGADCTGSCTFDGGICSWGQDDRDDFQWSLGRGSVNPRTGPIRDHSSDMYGGTAGGYAYIDSRYPRRPGDKARLISPVLPATGGGNSKCLKFWTHMFGTGIGTLKVLREMGNNQEMKQLWKLSGPAGNQWYQGQAPVSASEQFRLIIEAEVGGERLGDIAIDDVHLTDDVCPSAPQAAAPDSSDCTFEVDECGWMNPGRRDSVDQIDWERTTGREAKMPHVDHTTRTERGFLMRLAYDQPQRPGDTAWLVSPMMTGSDMAKCLTFWYFMDETVSSSTGPQLGGLKVWTKHEDEDGRAQLKPIWFVRNAQGPQWMYGQTTVDMDMDYQVIFEGMWGGTTSGAIALDDITMLEGGCEQRPGGASVSAADCDFTRGTCAWRNSTSDRENQQRWRSATALSRPRGLPDHTFRTQTGYVYFDIFSPQGRRLRLRLTSPVLEPAGGGQRACVTFWFAAMSATESARLRVIREAVEDEDNEQDGEPNGRNEQVIWSLRASDTEANRPTWMYGQADLQADSRHRLIFEGSASNFGFALDDVRIISGECPVRPDTAVPSRDDDDEEKDLDPDA